ncbi:hypothetical protein JCM11251_006438 [Rhodosporidiobolus azoricus]
MSTVDLHALYASRAIAKARAFVNRGVNCGGTAAGAGGGGGGMSKSPSYGGFTGGAVDRQAVTAEVNRRDHLGRTVLHLAVSETEPWAMDWVELLLSVPQGMIQLNAVDTESGWGPLHRALYCGNIAAARLLLARDDLDTRLKDAEGLSPFDVYNSTVDGTNPVDTLGSENPGRLEMFSWGSNRNYVLGFAGDNERQYPERLNLKREEGGKGLAAFEPLRVRDVGLSRLHAGIVTDEKRNNVRFCGYGGGGRLGPTTQTQFTFSPLRDFPHQVSQVVLSPDHTVIITVSGDVYTFGTSRFSQLGYPIEPPAPNAFAKGGRDEDPVQTTPRKVVGALKKEVVLGAAASRTHTAVFTADCLFTFGTNRGQLGYPAQGTAVQVLPRKVTLVQQPVVQLTATENATACLLESHDVVVLYHEAFMKIAFPLTPFPSRIVAYRPPQVSAKPSIRKIASCGNTFAALSSLGDVFTFTLDSGSTGAASSADGTSSPGHALARLTPKPQRIWNLRRTHTAVTDIGVGLDGSIILCTVSGHVFIRSRKYDVNASKLSAGLGLSGAGGGGSGGYKFSRVPFLQRVIKVASNSTGGFAALRADVPLRFIEIEGPTLAPDLLSLLPHWQRVGGSPAQPAAARRKKSARTAGADEESDDEEDDADLVIERDIEVAKRLAEVVERWDLTWEVSARGTDAVVNVGTSMSIPVHKAVLSARSMVLAQHFSKNRILDFGAHASPYAALLFLHYIYSDDFPAIWDTRVGLPLRETLAASPSANPLKLDVASVKAELRHLGQRFDLPALSQALERQAKTVPAPTLSTDFTNLLHTSLSPKIVSSLPLSLKPDVVLQLEDREIKVHSVVLRARCPFFTTFFEDADWSRERRKGGLLTLDVKHVGWEVMSLVLEHIYRDAGMSLFHTVERPAAEEYIDFTVQLLAVANELLLDKLKQVCSAVLRSFVTLNNVVSILCDAAFYEADDLARACMYYLSSSMETALEDGLLDALPPDLLVRLAAFVQERQGAKMPVSRSGLLLQELLAKHADYLADIDVGRPTGAAKRYRPVIVSNSPKPSPSHLSPQPSPQLAPSRSPRMQATKSSPSLPPVGEADEPFSLDEDFLLDGATSTSRGLALPSGMVSPPGSQTYSLSRRRSSLAPLSSSPSQSSYMPLGSPPPQRLQPWLAPAPVDSTKAPLDLRSIMANESAAAGRRVSGSRPTPPVISSAGPSGLSASSPSWRPVAPSRPSSLADIQSQQAASSPQRPAPPSPAASSLSAARPSPSRATPPVASPPPSADPAAAAGPVYTPSRLPPASRTASGLRVPKTSFGGSDTPWQNHERIFTPTPPVSPPSFDPFAAPAATSFAAIQAEQVASLAAVKDHKAPRSFADLMKEEQAAARRKAEEEKEAREFAKWFEEESKRVQQEQAALRAQATTSEGGGSGGKGKKSGGGRGKGGKKPAVPVAEGGATASSSPQPSPGPSGASTPKRGGGGGGRGGGGGGGGGGGRGRGGGRGGKPSTQAGGPVPFPSPGVRA